MNLNTEETLKYLSNSFNNFNKLVAELNEKTVNESLEIEKRLTDLSLEEFNLYLNQSRDALQKRLTDKFREVLDIPGNKSVGQKINFQIKNEMNLIAGRLFYTNDFDCFKKVRFINLKAWSEEVDLVEFNFNNFNNFSIQAILMISIDRILYVFKSKDNKQDMLIITNKNGTDLYKSIVTFENITFSRYLTCDPFIISGHNDFTNNKHQLKIFNSELKLIVRKKFNNLINLCQVNKNEIICFRPFEYMIFNYKLEILCTFGQFSDPEKPFYIETNCILGDLSKSYLFFKLTDELRQNIYIRVLDRSCGSEFTLISIKANDIFKCDFERDILFIKNLKSCKIFIFDFNLNLKIEQSSKQFEKLYFIDLINSKYFYSVNYKSNKIYLI